MAKKNVSRRNFITTLAASGAVATTQLSPFSSLASPQLVTGSGYIPRKVDEPLKIVCLQKLSQAEEKQIKAAGKNTELVILADSMDPKHLAEAEVIIGSVSDATLSQAKKLKWVQAMGAGVENMSRPMVEHPSVLTNMQRIYAPVIAESAIGLLLSLTRGLTQVSIPAFRERKWMQAPTVWSWTTCMAKLLA